MRYLPINQYQPRPEEEVSPLRKMFGGQSSPPMQVPELNWGDHPANQPVQQSSGEGVDWSKMFGGDKAMGPASQAQIAANSAVGGGFGMTTPPPIDGGESVGSMAADGAVAGAAEGGASMFGKLIGA